MRPLLLFIIGLVFGVGGGFLAAGGVTPAPHDHATHASGEHDHAALQAWDGASPDLQLTFTRAPDDAGINLHILTTGFEWAAERVDTPSLSRTGHAHIYVNGEKIMRAYGPWTHLPMVAHDAVVSVTLSTNDHQTWAINDAAITAEITVP